MTCVVPHGIRSLALTATHEDSQQKNSSNVLLTSKIWRLQCGCTVRLGVWRLLNFRLVFKF